MIGSLLIANRGEIACRIIRTARAMGVRTVAVYSDADAKALHVHSADEAVHIGPSPAAESYLRGDKIIAAAKATGAEAIHPGYGFLSENADFARAVIAAGLVWVGPRPESIEAMGLKDAAKQLMRAAGVPVTPGYDGADQSPETLQREADSIGYPVLIKAVAGGGGKGMRKVDAGQNFLAALESCKREANSSFGNSDVLLEKWITSPRHIEVQVFGDTHGNVVHLFERDCSLQRRHQKVIEEAPAPGMDPATREAICSAAVRAAKAVDYVGAGTIEFIADASEGLKADRVFFMEMNTRLQVEHPVTEEITGVDLVEWQLRVASGEPLPKRQDELSIDGWAMEARLYAEDPARGFLPSTGRLTHFNLNARSPSVFFPDEEGTFSFIGNGLGWTPPRFETGAEQGAEISPYYDPMIAKLICKGQSREAAAEMLETQCGAVEVWPVKTNAAFLRRLIAEPAFRAGEVTTGYIDAHLDRLVHTDPANEAVVMTAIALIAEPWKQSGAPQGFRLNAASRATATIIVDDEAVAAPIPSGHMISEVGGNQLGVAGESTIVFARGEPHVATLSTRTSGISAADGAILAPMPGKVIAVDVAEGEAVTKGQRLLVLEAMKMEHALTAPFDGTVVELTAHEGAQVQVEALLARVEKSETPQP